MTTTKTVVLALDNLADALGFSPEALAIVIDLAERLGGAKVSGDKVELPEHAVYRFGLVSDRDGRWFVPPDDVLRFSRLARTGRTRATSHDLAALRAGEVADPAALQPWEELSRAEEPPPNRVDSIVGWLNRWSAQDANRPTGLEPPPSLAPRMTDSSPVLAQPGKRRTKASSSFSLDALRQRLDGQARQRQAV